MSRNAKLALPFGDDVHEFFLGVAQLDELDEITGVGPGTLIKRIASGDMHSKDVRSVIRLGLIGGGMKSGDAVKLVARYVDPPVPLFESMPLAIRILAAAVYSDDVAEEEIGVKKNEEEPPIESTFGPSTETVQ